MSLRLGQTFAKQRFPPTPWSRNHLQKTLKLKTFMPFNYLKSIIKNAVREECHCFWDATIFCLILHLCISCILHVMICMAATLAKYHLKKRSLISMGLPGWIKENKRLPKKTLFFFLKMQFALVHIWEWERMCHQPCWSEILYWDVRLILSERTEITNSEAQRLKSVMDVVCVAWCVA